MLEDDVGHKEIRDGHLLDKGRESTRLEPSLAIEDSQGFTDQQRVQDLLERDIETARLSSLGALKVSLQRQLPRKRI